MRLSTEEYKARLEGYKTSTLQLIAELRETDEENSIEVGEILSDILYEEDVVVELLNEIKTKREKNNK